MERLKLVGHVIAKHSNEISYSGVGIGFEKLDRGVFDPNKAYDKVAAIGVKWARLQTGWARCEKEKGVYDFSWLDELVENFISRGITPWFSLSYGNPLYTARAVPLIGAVGCIPIGSEEEMEAWKNYVFAIVTHFKGRVTHYEVWNEPDIKSFWRHNVEDPAQDPGPDAAEYAAFCIETAKMIRMADPDANIMALAISRIQGLDYINTAFANGILEHIDTVSFHSYSSDDNVRPGRIRDLKNLCAAYGKELPIAQGETGCQSRSDGRGALKGMAWTPQKQLKHLLRNMIIDFSEDVIFSSYFTTVDMSEAAHGVVGDKSSLYDFGYFGVLGADFDENGFATGEYTPKPSYYALQTLASVFSEGIKPCELPIVRKKLPSKRVAGEDCADLSVMTYGFKKPNGAVALAYWNAVQLLSESYEGTISFAAYTLDEPIRIIDMSNGNVYEIPDSMKEPLPGGGVLLKNIPITDIPMLITFGNFCDITEE